MSWALITTPITSWSSIRFVSCRATVRQDPSAKRSGASRETTASGGEPSTDSKAASTLGRASGCTTATTDVAASPVVTARARLVEGLT